MYVLDHLEIYSSSMSQINWDWGQEKAGNVNVTKKKQLEEQFSNI